MRLFPSGQIKISVPCSTSSARTTPSIFFPLEFLCLPGSEFSADSAPSKERDRENARSAYEIVQRNRARTIGYSQSLKSPSLHFWAMSLAATALLFSSAILDCSPVSVTAAALNQTKARARFWGAPSPLVYSVARLNCARPLPCCAAMRNHLSASLGSFGTP